VINQRVAQLMLSKLGHVVDTVSDGLAAVDAAIRHHYDVVLMDLQMPGLDGLGATRRIWAQLPPDRRPRIVAVSASGRVEDRTACADDGVNDFLTKPLRLSELEAVLSGEPPQPVDSRADAIRERLADLAGPDPDSDSALFSQLLRQLVAQAPSSLDGIEEATRHADAAAVAEHAHSLRGSAANLGGDDLADLLAGIEDRARLDEPTDPGDVSRARAELAALSGSLLAVADELDRRSA
jgi:CheY-like chemotaxis protein